MRDCSYCQDGSAHLHMSDLGSCVRSQAAQLQGFSTVEAPEFMQVYFQRGHDHEAELVETMQAEREWTITGQQTQVVLPGAVPLVGHLDGLCTHSDYLRFHDTPAESVFEAKAPGAWAKFERAYKTADYSDPLMSRYAYQTSCYQHARNAECVVACVEDGKVKTFTIEVPIIALNVITERVDTIVQASKDGLPDCTQRDFPCPTRFLCNYDQDERITLDDSALAATLRTYQTLTETVRAGEAAEKARRKLKTDLPCGRYDVDGIDLTVYKQAGRKTLDEDAMIAAGIDVEAFRKTGAPSIRWKVS